MSMSAESLSMEGYQTRLPTFEGPLDVLLRLIERQKLEITQVSLVEVTDQFLLFIADLGADDTDLRADFTAVGSRLTVLKSRSILPRPPVTDGEDDVDPEGLVQQLRAYQEIKRVGARLGERFAAGETLYGHQGIDPVIRVARDQAMPLMTYDASVLWRALRRRLSTVPAAMSNVIQRRTVSIRDMIERVLDLTTGGRTVRFSTIVTRCQSRSDASTAFLAVLVLIRRRSLDAVQQGLYGEIDLVAIRHDRDVDLDGIGEEFVGG